VSDHYERTMPVVLLQPFSAHPVSVSDGSGFESHQDCIRVVSFASQTIHYPNRRAAKLYLRSHVFG
jgi:hypothetical protein